MADVKRMDVPVRAPSLGANPRVRVIKSPPLETYTAEPPHLRKTPFSVQEKIDRPLVFLDPRDYQATAWGTMPLAPGCQTCADLSLIDSSALLSATNNRTMSFSSLNLLNPSQIQPQHQSLFFSPLTAFNANGIAHPYQPARQMTQLLNDTEAPFDYGNAPNIADNMLFRSVIDKPVPWDAIAIIFSSLKAWSNQ